MKNILSILMILAFTALVAGAAYAHMTTDRNDDCTANSGWGHMTGSHTGNMMSSSMENMMGPSAGPMAGSSTGHMTGAAEQMMGPYAAHMGGQDAGRLTAQQDGKNPTSDCAGRGSESKEEAGK